MHREELLLAFERPIDEAEQRLRHLAWRIQQGETGLLASYRRAFEERARLRREIHGNVSAWEHVQLTRHPDRPEGARAARVLFGPLQPLRGDRAGTDDPTLLTGLGRWRGRTVAVVACTRETSPCASHADHAGMPGPAAFRKAQRLVRTAGRHGFPIATLVDTPGAFPGAAAERGGVAEAISRTFGAFARAPVPVLAMVLGEGGSGGALAMAMGDRVLMMAHAYFSVIGPEACASILWRDDAQTPLAAESLKLRPHDLAGFGIVDEIVAEPEGGAHRYPNESLCRLREAADRHLAELVEADPDELRSQRARRYRSFGTLQHPREDPDERARPSS